MKTKLLLAVLVIALIAGVAWRLGTRDAGGAAGPRGGGGGGGPIAVQTVPVRQLDFPRVLDLPGTLEAEDQLAIVPQVSGVLLRQPVAEGGAVRAGDVLFELDARPAQARVRQGQAALAGAEAEMADATRTLERLQPLLEPGYVSQQELDSARLALEAARARAATARAERSSAQLDAGYAVIRAPVSGTLGRVRVQPGQLVQAGAEALATVVAAGGMLVRASVAEQDWPQLAAARAAGPVTGEVRDKAGSRVLARGTLSFVDNLLDPASGAVAIKLTLKDPPASLLSGQALPLRLILGADTAALAVPDAAVQYAQEGSYVYVVRDGKAVAQPVQGVRSLDGLTQVRGTLRPGEAVLVEIPKRLKDGSAVKLAAGQSAGGKVAGGRSAGGKTAKDKDKPAAGTPRGHGT